MTSLRGALRWARGELERAGVGPAEWEASLLLEHLTGLPRHRLYLSVGRNLEDGQFDRLRALVGRRAGGEPLQYILGHTEFMGLELAVDPRVLIPRPDTEHLVEAVEQCLQDMAQARPDWAGPLRAADLGTGSGCIAVALAHRNPRLVVDAVDYSAGALQVAAANVRRHGLEGRVTLRQGDLLDPDLALPGGSGAYHALACNPPYVERGEAAGLAAEVREHEPHLALFGVRGVEPGQYYRALGRLAVRYLRPDGCLAVEIGADMAARVSEWLRAGAVGAGVGEGLRVARVARDYGGHERVVVAVRG